MLIPATLAQNMMGWFLRLSRRFLRTRNVLCQKVRASARMPRKTIIRPSTPIRLLVIQGLRAVGASWIAITVVLPVVRQVKYHAASALGLTTICAKSPVAIMERHPPNKTQTADGTLWRARGGSDITK